MDLLSVEPGAEADHFTGRSETYRAVGIYGGHFVAQALAAAFETVEAPKLCASLHSYFLKAGNPELPIDYQVTRLREGYKSDTRTIAARQDGVDVFHMIATFKLPENGDSHQPKMPDVPSPEECRKSRETRSGEQPGFPFVLAGRLDAEFASAPMQEFDLTREEGLRLWMRTTNVPLTDPREQQIGLAFLSDSTLMFNAGFPHGASFETHRVTTLDHSIWFHQLADPHNWMLMDQLGPAAGDGRGLNEGKLFTQDGKLALSCTQESLLRRIEPKA